MLRPLVVCTLALVPLGACEPNGGFSVDPTETSTGSETGDTAAPAARYRATIRRTGYGVAHIKADDLGSALFGQAYAFAQDHVCTLADQIVKVRSERAKYFGAGNDDVHLTSDFAYLALDIRARAEKARDSTPADVQEAIAGYTAGYNQFVRDTAPGALPADCAGAPWVREIEELDLYAYYVDLGLLGGSNQLVPYIGTAQPPGSGLTIPGGPLSGLHQLTNGSFGSNGWALGADKSASGGGMVVSNPHFPWTGELKLWESHLTVPGAIDVYGVGLSGVPGVLIGFNQHIGWAHTFSDGARFTLYKLTLAPGDPTSYMVDGQPRKMTSKTFEIEVQGAGKVSRTLWYSHYGPMLNVDPFGWTPTLGLTYRDANIENPRLIEQFLGMDRAESLDEFKAVYAEVQGIPWVNTMAADAEGYAWYTNASATAQLSDAAIEGWKVALDEDPIAGLIFAQGGLVLLDGSDSTNEWVDTGDARAPGLVPFTGLPQLDRRDFVFNSNDSHWLANPAEPLEGFSPLLGPERVPQAPRTRVNAMLLQNAGGYQAAGDDGKFTVDELKAAIMGNHSLVADLMLPAVLERCDGATTVSVDGASVDVRTICEVLGAWDRRFDPDSVGAVAWREFLATFSYEALLDGGVLFSVSFDADDPIATPNTVIGPPAEGQVDRLLQGLGKATLALNGAKVSLSTPLRQVQRAPRGGVEVGVPGGTAREGIANVVGFDSGLNSTLLPKVKRPPVLTDGGLTERGYVVNYGSSFVMAIELTKDGPQGEAFLTYAQSGDERSPHYRDQTIELFAAKKWRKLLFREQDIAADPALVETVIEGG